MKDMMFKAWVKAQMAKQSAKDFFTSEEGGADSIIIAVVIIIAVIALGVLFREQIFGWFNSLTGKVDEQIEGI
ncbi:MAG: hypothetical protein ACI4Q4_08010 [Oscillospiraceae bacterium]